jgi:RNase H-like domain found in reverse transcriptase
MKAFELLKTLMCRRPILAQPDYTKPFILHTDASGYGVGAILLQEGDPNPERPLKFRLHPITYYSATFIPAECNYDIYERELLAVVKSLKHWRQHLGFTRHPFTIVTDHANLAFWKEPQDLNRCMARWHALLQDYWFNIQVTSGKLHMVADFLSHLPSKDKGVEDNKQVVVLPEALFVDSHHEIPDEHRGLPQILPVDPSL